MTTLPRVLLAALALVAAPAPATSAADASCDLSGIERVVAVGDVHGAYENFVAVLRMAGLIDAKERWSGGRAHLVQTGDVLDRGPHSRKAMDLLMRLEKEARKAAGRVHALLGNHEVMNLRGDLRYVSAGEYEAFRDRHSEELRERFWRVVLDGARARAKAAGETLDEKALRERFLAETPLGFVEHRRAFGKDGTYGAWLRQHDAVVRIDGVAFLHGGLSPAVAPLGCAAINETVRRELAADPAPDAPVEGLVTREDGPFWYRGLAQEDEATFGPALDGILTAFGARALVVGHTVSRTGRIQARFAGRVVMIDAGMFEDYGGNLAALEVGSGGMTALYPNERVPLGSAKAARTRPDHGPPALLARPDSRASSPSTRSW